MAAYHKVEVSLNTNAVEVGIPSPQTVNVVVPTIGPAGPVGSVGPVGPTGPQGVPGTGLEVLTTQGDLLYQGASTGQRLAIGTSGQVLKVANGIPAWGNESGAVTSVNGETGTVILDGSEIDSSGNDDLAAFVTYEFADGNGIYYPLPDSTLNSKRVYRNTTGHHVFFQSLRWHITDGSPITANIIESSDDDNAAWPWLSAWDGSIEKAKLSTIVGRARSTFLFVGDSVPSTSVSGLGTAATSDSTAFAPASHAHGNITNSGAIGTTANLPLKTGTNGVVEAGSFGTAAGSFCEGNDARLSDDRDPNLHAASHAAGGSDPIEADSLASTNTGSANALLIADGIGGTSWDTAANVFTAEVGPADIGAASASHTHAAADVTDLGTAATSDTGDFAASGSITSSGLTQSTARILGRTTASTGSIEEIQIGSGLSLSAGELSATSSGGISAVGASTADVLSVSGSDLVADDPNADRIVFWDDSEGKLRYLEAGSGLSISGTTMTVTATGGATNLWIPASAWIPKTTAGCGVDSRETTTNDQNFDELLFDTGSDEFADALVVMPSNYNNGTVTARFYWTAASGSGGVAWGIQGRAFANDDALDTAAGTAQLVTDTLIAANDMHITSATSAVTIGGTPAANTPIQFTIYRDVSDASDTLGVDARLLGVEIIFN